MTMTITKTGIKRYSEVIKLPTFRERFLYLKLDGEIGRMTFGGHRELNQILYSLPTWKHARREAILRDQSCDLALSNYPIFERVCVHHLNPITIEDVLEQHPSVFDLENLISVSFRTHNMLHYGSLEGALPIEPIVRTQNDTIPWR